MKCQAIGIYRDLKEFWNILVTLSPAQDALATISVGKASQSLQISMPHQPLAYQEPADVYFASRSVVQLSQSEMRIPPYFDIVQYQKMGSTLDI